MFCTKCGQQLPDGSAFCSVCGAPQAAPAPQPQYQQPVQPQYQQPVQPQYQQPAQAVYPQPAYMPQTLSRKDFYDRFVSKKVRSTVTSMVIICFITAVISVPLMIVLENPLALLDIAVYALMGTLLLVTKHWVCALIPTLYSAVWTVVSMVNDGTPTGIVALIVGATCISVLQKFEKMYQAYQTTGVLPAQQL